MYTDALGRASSFKGLGSSKLLGEKIFSQKTGVGKNDKVLDKLVRVRIMYK